MLSQRLGEGVSARAIGDEIEILGRERMQHRLNGGQAGVANRARRQALVQITVVGTLDLEIGRGDGPPERTRPVSYGIDHRRVGLQWHAAAQAVGENAGDMCALHRRGGLLFHDRGQSQRLVDRVVRQVGGTLRPELL